MKLDEIIDVNDMESEIAAGYINRRFHPEFPSLAIVGYSDRAQFDNRWSHTIVTCRGIIYDVLSMEVLARPFAKFFNHGQGGAQYDPDAPVFHVSDKVDGSLGIGYLRPDGVWAIATRGSFDSEQARHANAMLTTRPWSWMLPWLSNKGATTPLFEIIYPANRIVVDYGDTDRLIPLGAVSIETGEYIRSWGEGVRDFKTLREVLSAPQVPNAEGFVVWLDPITAVKIKFDQYVALHRIISNLTVKEVWRQLRAGTFDDFAVALPDEFHDWAKRTANELRLRYVTIEQIAHTVLNDVKQYAGADRKSQALWLKATAPDSMSYVFGLLDGKDIADSIWRTIEPVGSGNEIATAELLAAA